MSTEYIDVIEQAPLSTEEVQTPIQHSFSVDEKPDDALLPGVKASLSETHPFFRGTKLKYAFRAYSFDRRDSAESFSDATTVGGRFEYTSGSWHNISLLTSYYSSLKISETNGGATGLLTIEGDNINVWGEANVTYEFTKPPLAKTKFRFFRQRLKMPYMNDHDIRMLNSTYEAYMFGKEDPVLGYGIGHIRRFKKYNNNEFISMSEAAGAPGTKEGVSVVGIRGTIDNSWTVGGVNHYGWNTFNTFYIEAVSEFRNQKDLDLELSLQLTDQRSVQKQLVGEFNTHHLGFQLSIGVGRAIFTLAGSATGKDSAIHRPWGGSPSYLSIQRYDFDRAGEQAWLLGISYRPEATDPYGLSGFINIAHGGKALNDATGEALPDRTEYDITIDWKPPEGKLEGLWIRGRGAWFDIEGNSALARDYRLIVNYEFQLL